MLFLLVNVETSTRSILAPAPCPAARRGHTCHILPFVYIYIYIYIYTSLSLYIYIYRERDR